MKRFLALLLALAMVFALCACNNSSSDDTSDKDDDAQSTESTAAGAVSADELGEGFTLKVGFDAEYPPFGYVAEDGSYDGFDLALAKEVCERLGWNFEAVPIQWDAKDAELAAGNINCIWNGFTMTGRESDYCWSDAYCENSIVMVVLDSSDIETFDDLAGKTVMSQSGSSATDALNDNEELKSSLAEVVELSDYQMGFMELDQGTVDAIAVDIGVARSQINKAGDDNSYRILEETVSTEYYAIGFLLGNDALRDAVNEEVKAMAEDGTMLEIANSSDYIAQGLDVEALCMINGD